MEAIDVKPHSDQKGWIDTTLGAACELVMGQSPPSSEYNDAGQGLPFFQGKTEFGDMHPTPVKWCTAPTKRAIAGDVLLSVRAPVGPTNLADQECCIGRGLSAVRPLNGTLSKYVLYYLRSIANDIDALGTGTTFKAVSGKVLRDVPFPLAPLPEQRRIVEAIERQLGRLDAAVARLHAAKAKLKRYKQAVLKAAYDEGDLNLSGKKGHDGAEWLKLILAKRKNLALNAAKYNEPEAPDTEWMPELPDGWTWASLEQITHPTDVITYGVIKLGDDTPGGVPCIRSSDLKSLRLNLETVKTIRKDIADNYKRTYLEGGEVIFAIRGTIGGVAVAPTDCKGYNIAREVARIKLVDERLNQYVAFCLAGPFLSAWFSTRLKGIAYTGINIEILKQAPIPIPPPHVLKAIIERTDDRLERHDNVLSTLDAQLQQAVRLRQAVLKRAFEGRLVGGVDPGTP
ncbi:MAG TPA: restriction endonuclease subunit S [Flavobacteriales bacterium]|nr:restriction endonuclease subunit S [Flavobacteriales bacterium]